MVAPQDDRDIVGNPETGIEADVRGRHLTADVGNTLLQLALQKGAPQSLDGDALQVDLGRDARDADLCPALDADLGLKVDVNFLVRAWFLIFLMEVFLVFVIVMEVVVTGGLS